MLTNLCAALGRIGSVAICVVAQMVGYWPAFAGKYLVTL